jgi:type IV pilus assembly protein PilM
MGNAMKLPGLQKYLSQNLGHPVTDVQRYRAIEGAAVVDAPAFKENLLSFAVCYGLVLQGLEKSRLSTNLLPPEIVTDRMIRDKKPWAVSMVAALVLGITINFFGHWRAYNSVAPHKFQAALGEAQGAADAASQGQSEYEAAKSEFTQVNDVGEGLVGNVEGRLLWLEMLTALNQCLPDDPEGQRPDEIAKRNEIHVQSLECEWFADLSSWHTSVAEKIKEQRGQQPAADAAAAPPADGQPPDPNAAAPPADPSSGAPPGAPPAAPGDPNAAADPAASGAAGVAEEPPPTGPGWVIQLRGHHFHNEDLNLQTAAFVRETLMKNLREKKVELADKDGKVTELPIKDLGIGYPVIISPMGRWVIEERDDPNAGPNGGGAKLQLKRWDFVLQFVWQPTPPSKRLEKQQGGQNPQAPALAGGAAGGQ